MPAKAAATGSGPTWEFKTDKGEFKEFPSAQGAELEKAFASGADKVDMTVGSQKYSIDLQTMQQKNLKTGTERMIRRVAKDGEILTRVPVWEWQHDKAAWSRYGSEESKLIEKAFQANSLKTVVKIATSAHDTVDVVIHFGHMTQSTAKNPDKSRPIRRLVVTEVSSSLPGTQEDKVKKEKGAAPDSAKRGTPPSSPPVVAKRARVEVEDADDDAPTFVRAVAASGVTEKSWTAEDSVLLLVAHQDPHKNSRSPKPVVRVAAFDMDDTLVKAKGGRVFAQARDDWEWLCPEVPAKVKEYHAKGYHVVIISNQAGISTEPAKAKHIQGKIIDLSAALGIPISAALATEKDGYRKPEPKLWELVVDKLLFGCEVDKDRSFYCGDAAGRGIYTLAGRKKDFGCGDRKFAYNAGLPFFTPEEMYQGKAPEKNFDWGVGPDVLKSLPSTYPKSSYASSSKPELVVFVGYPGCGKSSFYRRFFQSAGYVHVNRDTLKTKEKCIAAAKEALEQKKSVCIDNTNPTKDDRSLYVAVAKKLGVSCRCIQFTADIELAQHMNVVRQRLGGEHVPGIAYNTFKSKFQEPSVSEGFDEVISVPPVAKFEGLPNREALEKAFFTLS